MGIIIKTSGVQAPEGAEKLYRDALVTEGSLLLHDYSNRGTLVNFSLAQGAKVRDLAREAALPAGVDNETEMSFNSSDVSEPTLTNGYGFRLDNLGVNTGGANRWGFDLGFDLLEYLHAKQPNSLIIFWLRRNEGPSGAFITSNSSDGGGNGFPIRANLAGTSNFNPSFAGAGAGNVAIGSSLLQYAVEFRGAGQPLRRFVNGVYHGTSDNTAEGFGTPSEPLVIGKIDTINRLATLYRLIIEDLDVSGRTADDVTRKDWEYCTGMGSYSGLPTKRPFIDTV